MCSHRSSTYLVSVPIVPQYTLPVEMPIDTPSCNVADAFFIIRAQRMAREVLAGWEAVGTPHRPINTHPLSSTRNWRNTPPHSNKHFCISKKKLWSWLIRKKLDMSKVSSLRNRVVTVRISPKLLRLSDCNALRTGGGRNLTIFLRMVSRLGEKDLTASGQLRE